jgi:biopolymer transport protein TolR
MGGSLGSKADIVAELNVVPLIDILLVLLVIFMVITPLKSQGLSARVPQADNGKNSDLVVPPVVVQVFGDSVARTVRPRINGEDVSWEALGPRLAAIFAARSEKVAFLTGANDVMFMDVARAMDVMRGVGIVEVGLLPSRLPPK